MGPRYRTIVANLSADIDNGILKPGDKIPSTPELCLKYEVSATVINQAILILSTMGLVYGVPGVGRFVTHLE